MSRSVLLVTPGFHGYWRSISSALERRGHHVDVVVYDRGGRLDRARHKIAHEVPAKLGVDTAPAVRRRATDRALAAFGEVRPDVVVVVKGDVLDDRFWQALDERRTARVVWLYDEIRRTAWTPAGLGSVGPVASYSRLDAETHGLTHLPLAFDPDVATIDPRTRNDEVVFIGARYPRRAELVTGLAARGLPVRAYGRDWSHHPVDRLRTYNSARPAVQAERDLARDDTYREMAAAFATLNVHGDQDGFTMRTFEASGVGGLQLVDRTDLDGLYDPGTELLSFTDLDDLTASLERLRGDPAWGENIRRAGRERTLAEHTFDHRVRTLEAMWEESR